MATQSNVEVVRDAYAAFGSGDLPKLLGLMASDVVWEFPASNIIPGPARSPGPVRSGDSLPP